MKTLSLFYFSLFYHFLKLQHHVKCDRADSFGMQALLEPIKNLQMVIRPAASSSSSAMLETPFQTALAWTMENHAPIQLFTSHEVDPSALARRYSENQAACLILASSSSDSENKVMELVLASAVLRSNGIQGRTQGKDLIYLIRIHKKGIKMPENKSYIFIPRCLSPYYLIFLDWYPPNGIRSDTMQALDVCYDASHCRIVSLPQYHTLAADSVSAIQEHIRSIQKDFQGDRLTIRPRRGTSHPWEFWQRFLQKPQRHLQCEEHVEGAFGVILGTFARMHNFTFDTFRYERIDPCKSGAIYMYMENFHQPELRQYHPARKVMLEGFSHVRAIMSSELPPNDPHKFRSLLMPLSTSVTCMTLGILFCMTPLLTALGSNKGCNVAASCLLASSPICAQVASDDGKQFGRIRHVFVPWMIIVSILSTCYTNMLQSIVIVPGTQVVGLSLDEMVYQNFTFLAFSAWLLMLKEYTQKEELTSSSNRKGEKWDFLRKEKIIGERVQRWRYQEDRFALYLTEINQDTKRVLIADQDSRLIFERITLELGRNVILGEERFFENPYLWTFYAEKSHMLLESMERMKSTGLVHHFLVRSIDKIVDILVQFITSPLRTNEDNEVATTSGLSDSINMEALTLFHYGVVCSVVAFIIEMSLSGVKAYVTEGLCSACSAN